MASISPSIIKTGTSEKSNNQIATETSAPVTSMESNATQSSTDIAVTPQRKQELLLEARRARVEWVDSSSNPFRFDTSLDDGHDADLHSSAEANGFKAQESDQKNVIQNTYAGKSIPSVVEVVNMLYGLGEEEGGGLNQKSLNARIINQVRILYFYASYENFLPAKCGSFIFCQTPTIESFSCQVKYYQKIRRRLYAITKEKTPPY